MSSKPIQLANNAFLMLQKAIENADAGIGIGLSAADIVPAAELIDAEYASVRDVNDKVELHGMPAGVKYMKMIDALLALPREGAIVESEIPEEYRWDPSEENVPDKPPRLRPVNAESRGFAPTGRSRSLGS
jgi:hypothetical protein